jgi:hypothetical protein
MRQTFMTITCDKCGVQQTFETVNVNSNGPIVVTRDPIAMLERAGWVCLRSGLRGVDICEKCKGMSDD